MIERVLSFLDDVIVFHKVEHLHGNKIIVDSEAGDAVIPEVVEVEFVFRNVNKAKGYKKHIHKFEEGLLCKKEF